MVEEKKLGQGEGEFPDPKGMQGWLEREITDVMKAAELRIKDATQFVNAYARGELSTDEAAHRCYEYETRWGAPLPGVMRSRGLTDEQIMTKINEERVAEGLLDKHVLKRRDAGKPDKSR